MLRVAIIIKGMLMGLADIIPGISGGTIAFITGIYEELLDTIKSFGFRSIKLLFQFQFKGFLKSINAGFLFPLVSGILLSIIFLSEYIHYFLNEKPIFIWSLFFGLILGSVYEFLHDIKDWNFNTFFKMLLGASVAIYIIYFLDFTLEKNYIDFFIAGAFAIVAMILPGVSGSFILFVLGMYDEVIYLISSLKTAVINMDIENIWYYFTYIGSFAIGAICSLLIFTRLISYLYKRIPNSMILFFTGFIVGSLPQVWPWKSDKDVTSFANLYMPSFTDERDNLWQGISLFLVGIVLAFLLFKFKKIK